MFSTRLNLLSPEKKTHLQRLMYWQFLKTSIESFLVILCLSGIMLLGAEWILQGYFNDLSASLSTSNKIQAEKNFQIKHVNRVIHDVGVIQEIYALLTPRLLEFAAAIPSGIILTDLTTDSAAGAYTLSGVAAARDDLLALQTALEALDFIDSVPIPLAQLTAKENVSFSLTATGKQP